MSQERGYSACARRDCSSYDERSDGELSAGSRRSSTSARWSGDSSGRGGLWVGGGKGEGGGSAVRGRKGGLWVEACVFGGGRGGMCACGGRWVLGDREGG